MCCYTAVAAAAAASAAAVRYRVADGKICCCVSLNLIPVSSFSSSKHDYFQCTPWQYCRIFIVDFFNLQYISYILGITGMRGAKAGASPPRRNPPCTYIFPSRLLSSPFFSLSLLVVTQIRGRMVGSSLSPLRFVPCLAFLSGEDFSTSSLVDSSRIDNRG